MNTKQFISKSHIDDEDTTFLDLRGTLFSELTEDAIVEIADLHVIPSEKVIKNDFTTNEDNDDIALKNGSKVISEKEFTKVLIPPLRGVRGGVLMVQTQKHPSRGEFDLGKFFSGNHLKTDKDYWQYLKAHQPVAIKTVLKTLIETP